ncbi:hypothetical protein C5471_02245 [Photorhabdus tasmaniensis]|uniref:Uncharacterized protein n=1 Tax=Photorhabdus tasmaniensis TaxID=1004159 RepID=A0ABX0GE74_9GAMM|nr:hypothetical protein [Photorhabdus tasmaniensis]
MLTRNLEVFTSYFSDLLESAPQHRENVRAILVQIEIMKRRPDFSLEPSILLARKETDECSICKKQVLCDE